MNSQYKNMVHLLNMIYIMIITSSILEVRWTHITTVIFTSGSASLQHIYLDVPIHYFVSS